MQLQLKTHIRQRFLIFLMLVSIVPLALVSRFFLQDYSRRLNEALDSHLLSSAKVSQSLYQEGLHSLSFSLKESQPLFQRLAKLYPELNIRLYTKASSGSRLLFDSNPIMPQAKFTSGLEDRKPFQIFKEKVESEDWRSVIIPINAQSNAESGYLVLSTSNQTAEKKQYGFYVALYLMVVGCFVILTAFFFNCAVIRPINELVTATNQVSSGNLDIRLQDRYPDEEMKALVHNFNHMVERLAEDQQLRATFISTLTHDLRTPLYAQKRVLEGIEHSKSQYDELLTLMLETAQKANIQLIEMVNLLLEAYQYEAGSLQLNLETVHLHRLIEELLETLAPLAQAESIGMVLDIPQSIELQADPLQLRRVFQNLISNGIANIQAGKEIRVSAQEQEEEIHIKVADNGLGIPPEVLSHLFQRYYTGHAKQQLGSGLGLFICRMIVEYHGGSITASSLVGSGTEFHLRLPKQAAAGR